jgi:DNA-binding CsgD family transcriptional regulator
MSKPELTRREAVFFELFKQGLSDRQIGILAGVGAGTVSHHINNIRKKYKVRTRRELMIASRKEWVGLTDEERTELWRNTDMSGMPEHDYGKAVEAKLKEKNG